MRIGVVSDTHGLLRPEVLPLLAGADHILHLGDVGDPEILGKLATVAPVIAIRGNIDTHGPCARLPETEVATIAGHNFYMLHNVQRLDLNPAAAGFAAVLYGHSHKPEIHWKKGILYLNPGSCGPRRFKLPVTCARITIDDNGRIEAKILELPITPV
ncbi:metallophosphoesterase family protein [Acidicapsa acidisoli]|uniref:metallophosphoesterase family protein n=1 Tax=Acidicapsa acidisoli TaxID=1615681 RepID=UPI0021DFC48F|nr:metallophosphoesterase family protein [Acidicapsa acidisoli]